MAENDDADSLQSLLTWSPDADGTYVVEVARFSREPLGSDGSLMYSQPSACGGTTASSTVVAESTTLDTTASSTAVAIDAPSINAECTEQTVEYEAGGIRYLSQELLSSETYTWSTIGQTEEVGH